MSIQQRVANTLSACPPEPPTLLPEASLVSVLRKVERGEIHTCGPRGVISHRDQLLPCRLVSALGILCRDRYVAMGLPAARDGDRVARLTTAGASLLAAWCQPGGPR